MSHHQLLIATVAILIFSSSGLAQSISSQGVPVLQPKPQPISHFAQTGVASSRRVSLLAVEAHSHLA